MMLLNPKVGIVTVSYGVFGGALTTNMFASIGTTPDRSLIHRMVTVFSGDAPPEYDALKHMSLYATNVDIIPPATYDSLSAAWNRGVFLCGDCDIIVVMNNDLILHKGWLAGLVDELSLYDDTYSEPVGIACPQSFEGDVHPTRAPSEASVMYADPMLHRIKCLGYLYGPCFAVRREVFLRCGLFDERIRGYYYEDTDFAYRVGCEGILSSKILNSVVYHYGSSSVSTRPEDERSKLAERNRLYFEEKHGICGPLPAGRTHADHNFDPQESRAKIVEFWRG